MISSVLLATACFFQGGGVRTSAVPRRVAPARSALQGAQAPKGLRGKPFASSSPLGAQRHRNDRRVARPLRTTLRGASMVDAKRAAARGNAALALAVASTPSAPSTPRNFASQMSHTNHATWFPGVTSAAPSRAHATCVKTRHTSHSTQPRGKSAETRSSRFRSRRERA